MERNSNVGRDERVKAEFFDGNAELAKLSFISLDHVRMGLPNLLEFSLDLANSLVLKLLNLLKRAAYHAKSLGIDACSREDLVCLGILRLQALLDRLELLLEDDAAEACLAMDIVDNVVELFEELLLLLLNVLVLLEAHFVLPLVVCVLLLRLDDFALPVSQLLAHLVVLHLPL